VNQHNSNVQPQNSQSNQSAHPKIQHINKERKNYKVKYNTVNTINSQRSTSSMGLSFPDTQEQISVTIGEKVGSGGEGDVYERKNYPNEAIKLYNKQALARIPKLKAMILLRQDRNRIN